MLSEKRTSIALQLTPAAFEGGWSGSYRSPLLCTVLPSVRFSFTYQCGDPRYGSTWHVNRTASMILPSCHSSFQINRYGILRGSSRLLRTIHASMTAMFLQLSLAQKPMKR